MLRVGLPLVLACGLAQASWCYMGVNQEVVDRVDIPAGVEEVEQISALVADRLAATLPAVIEGAIEKRAPLSSALLLGAPHYELKLDTRRTTFLRSVSFQAMVEAHVLLPLDRFCDHSPIDRIEMVLHNGDHDIVALQTTVDNSGQLQQPLGENKTPVQLLTTSSHQQEEILYRAGEFMFTSPRELYSPLFTLSVDVNLGRKGNMRLPLETGLRALRAAGVKVPFYHRCRLAILES